ncbi:MAG: CDP-glycerol glycerophosphotransferase family protein [Ignisphaera sp.]
MRDVILRVLKEILFAIADLWIIILSFIVPKDQNLFCFNSYFGEKFFGNPKYLYLYFSKRGKKCVVLCTKDELCRYLKQLGINVTKRMSILGFITVLRCRYFFIDWGARGITLSNVGAALGNFKIIQTWHGVGFKEIELLMKPKNPVDRLERFITRLYGVRYYFIIATSEHIKKKFERAFGSKRVFITGLPRNDVLFNKRLLFNDYKKSLKLESFSRVILYAPTYRENNRIPPFTREFLLKLDSWLGRNNSILLVKRHINDNTLKIPDGLRFIKDISDIVDDIQDLLPHVHILVSDYSSVVTDFALLRRPIILYLYDMEDYITSDRSLYFDPREVFPGPFAYTEEELFKLLKDPSWFEEPSYKSKYDSFVDFYHKYKDGRSCERIEILLNKLNRKVRKHV